ncbi:MAG TPA: hypothetical protein VGV38_12970 [Pyrinomonadaceae bacterium]|nr:hypothetical protein [Pyrinomonadaceae bacterium]
MSSNINSERIDTLFALALAFGADGGDAPPDGSGAAVDDARALELFASLGASERLALERRAAWHARLPEGKRREWLAYVLGGARARGASAQLDEHVHPSHVVEVLRDEPAYIRRLVLAHLPHALASRVEEAFGERGRAGREKGRRRTRSGSLVEESPAVVSTPAPEVVSVVRRAFLTHFTSRAELARVTPLEILSGVELARLVHLLGVRETALACRAIQAVEAVASFLRRFGPEDARAIALHISTLTEVDPRRVAFADGIVHEAFSAEPEPAAMLNRAGLQLLALTLSARDESHARYVAQKLPVEVARWLLRATARYKSGGSPVPDLAPAREILRVVAREADELAAGVKRPPRQKRVEVGGQ